MVLVVTSYTHNRFERNQFTHGGPGLKGPPWPPRIIPPLMPGYPRPILPDGIPLKYKIHTSLHVQTVETQCNLCSRDTSYAKLFHKGCHTA